MIVPAPSGVTPLRLAWEAHPEGGFIAYPHGRSQPSRRARITAHPPSNGWTWSVAYDSGHITDVATSKQRASDAANEAWPRVMALAAKAGERTSWEERQLAMIAAAERGEVGPEYFANDKAAYDDMLWVMDRIRPRPGCPPIAANLQRVVDALSREMFKFRTGERK